MKTKRHNPEEIAYNVAVGGHMKLSTLTRLLELLNTKTDYPHHIAVEITVGPLLKVLDNESDALETIRRLEKK